MVHMLAMLHIASFRSKHGCSICLFHILNVHFLQLMLHIKVSQGPGLS
jgi:hypothetical protein